VAVENHVVAFDIVEPLIRRWAETRALVEALPASTIRTQALATLDQMATQAVKHYAANVKPPDLP
jgi:hypothetical protein